MVRLRTLLVLVIAFTALPMTVQAVSDDRVFAFAEANFSTLFSGTPVKGVLPPYNYRFYPVSGNYLAVDSSGNIAMLGPATGGNIQNVGPKLGFERSILDWEASLVTRQVCSVNATLSFGVQSTPYRLCYSNLPPGWSCGSGGVGRQVADFMSFGPGYTHTASYASADACPAGSTVVDLGGDRAGSWQKVTPTLINSGLDMNDVLWDGQRFLAIGSRYVVYSTNGVNWTQAQAPAAGVGTLNSLAQSDSARVAVGGASGGASTLLRSSDGLSWQRVTPPATATASLSRVIWAGGQFVAVGASHHILTSSDGQSWTRRAAPAGTDVTGNIVDVAWNGLEYFAVGNDNVSGFLHRSSDGVNWTTLKLAAGTFLHAIHWDGTRWSASVQAGASHLIFTSHDAVTWTAAPLNAIFPVKRIVSAGPRLLGIGGALHSSKDGGLTWTELKHGMSQGLSVTNGRGASCSDSQCLILGAFGSVYSTF